MKWISKPPLGTLLNWAHPLNKGLVGFWLFNEGMGNKAYDISGNRNHGTLTGMAFPPSAASGWNPGRKGKSLQFDGVNDYVDAGNAASLNITTEITVSAWVYPNIQTNHSGIVWKKQQTYSPDYGLMILVGQNITFRVTNTTGGTGQPTSGKPLNNGWHYLVGTYDGAMVILYIDGINVAQAVLTGLIANSGEPVRIGTRDSNANFYNGTIDEVRIWNRALSASEVQELYINPYGMFL